LTPAMSAKVSQKSTCARDQLFNRAGAALTRAFQDILA
jgi:hypothetical protein